MDGGHWAATTFCPSTRACYNATLVVLDSLEFISYRLPFRLTLGNSQALPIFGTIPENFLHRNSCPRRRASSHRMFPLSSGAHCTAQRPTNQRRNGEERQAIMRLLDDITKAVFFSLQIGRASGFLA